MKCFYYASRSPLRLEAACDALRRELQLPEFTFDSHDNWRYAWVDWGGKHLNVTRASDCTTIETWMKTCPSDVNYQIILTAESEPVDFASMLAGVLGTPVGKHHETTSP